MNTTDNTTTGWIKLYRSILQWEWWDDPKATRLFIYCLIKANPKDRKWRGRTIERGTFITSYSSIKNDTRLTVQEIRTAINHLKSTGEITTETTNELTKITITNYDKYQDTPQAEQQTNQQAEQQAGNKQATSEQQASNNNEEYKNVRRKEVNFDDVSLPREREFIKNNFEDLESGNGEADAVTPQQAPTPQPPAHSDSIGDRYRPISELYGELREQYATETESANAIRMKLNREYRTLLTPEQLGGWFDQYNEAIVAGGMTIDTTANYRIHFRNWIFKQFEKKQQEQQQQQAKNRNNGNNNQTTERPRQIAEASQFVDRL